MPAFESMWAKIRRATEHAETVRQEITAWSDSHPYSIIKQANAEGTRHSVNIEVLKEPSLERWALVTGDCVHNLRSALDHMIYQIAIIESREDPPTDEMALEFPITDTAEHFELWRKRKRITSLGATTWAAIEEMQPYNRPPPHDVFPAPLLVLLRRLDNADKHRLLQVSFVSLRAVEFKNIHLRERVEGWSHIGPVTGSREIAWLSLDHPVPLDYEVRTDLAIVIGMGPKGYPEPKGYTEIRPHDLLRLLIGEVQTVIKHLVSGFSN